MRHFNDWLLLPHRIALHEPSATAVIADVHLGYSAARQRLGDAVPWRTVPEEMAPLILAARLHSIRSLIVAGDLFERGFDSSILAQFMDLLQRLRIEWTALVPGNHDRGLEKAGDGLPVFAGGFDLDGWHVCHGDQPVTAPRAVMGHWHPAVSWQRRKTPAFMVRANHLVLPAFSRDAAGVNVRADERWHAWECYPICGQKVTALPMPRRTAQQKTHGKRRGS